jgi:phage gpG-like protein
MITVQIEGLARIKTEFNSLSARIKTGIPKILLILAQYAKTLITNRVVDHGRDVNDQPFKRYSKKYEARKIANENKKKPFKPGTVNLYDTGLMMAAVLPGLDSPVQAHLSVVGGPAVYALAHQLGTRGPKREWFGLTPEEAKYLSDKAEVKISALLASIQ